MRSFQQISCILTHLEKDNVLRRKRANCCRKVLFQRSIWSVSPFLYPQGDVARSEWRLDTRSNNPENDGFFDKQIVRDPRVSDRCFRCDHRRQRRRFLGSLCSWKSRPTLCLCYERQRTTTHPHPAQESFCTQQVVASLQGVGGHSPVLLTRHSMFGARPQASVQSRAYWIFLDKLSLRSMYAIGTTVLYTDIASYRMRLCNF